MSERIIQLELFQGVRVLPPAEAPPPSPISVVENDDFYEIRSTLPGVDAEDVVVGIADDVLTISAKVCIEAQRTLGPFFSVDHRIALIEQSFALPPDASLGDLTTSFHEGVLSVYVNRRPMSNVVPFYSR